MRSLCLAFLATALLAGASALADDQPPVVTPDPPATPEALADIAGFAGMARRAAEKGDLDLAEKFYGKLLIVDAPDEAKKQALFDMFECYRTRNIYSKAIAVGERVHVLFPADPGTPDLLLKLGRLYRETGAYELAIARF